MRIRAPFVVAVALAMLALLATLGATWVGAREAALAEAEGRADESARMVGEVLALRAQRERASLRARPQQDLAARLHDTLAASGAGTGLLSEVAAYSSTTQRSLDGDPRATSGGSSGGGGGGKYAVQQMRVSLRSARLSDLGKFLERWRATQPLWTVSSVDISRAPPPTVKASGAGGAGGAAGSTQPDERFNATLVLTTTYVSARKPGATRQ